uniref:Imaginal disc growth factor n=1 Tax=Micropterix calthella TaxID=41027 RepID=A0A5Q0MVS1_9NEOP|nr:imaginal disc growth factor [Micropterix calthella]
MRSLVCLAALCAFAVAGVRANGKVFCYYDSKSYIRETQAKMLPSDLEPALPSCTHLVYGYAGVAADTYKMVPLNENLELDQGRGNYRHITSLKNKFHGLKVLLSVGGDVDDNSDGKYNTLLEDITHRKAFIESAILIAKNYNFDGIDLAWEFPKTKPKRVRNAVQEAWHTFKGWFRKTPVDDKAVEHRDGFTSLVREFKNTVRNDPNFLLTHTVLPNTNTTVYHDVPALIYNLDYVILDGFDFTTPDRNPDEADYSAPLYELRDRNPQSNLDFLVKYWLRNGAPGTKIIVGIPTYGRAWAMTSDSQISGVPALTVDGKAVEGPYTKEAGLLSYPEICTKLNSPANVRGIHNYFREVTDPTRRFGTYAFRLADDNGNGIWVSYEDPDTAGNKGNYVRSNNLGGVAIVDLSLDDFRGLCKGDKFPLLRAARFRI